LVYGAIQGSFQQAEANKSFSICEPNSTKLKNIPGPIQGQTINWIHGSDQ
jgi:hypothetical protein